MAYVTQGGTINPLTYAGDPMEAGLGLNAEQQAQNQLANQLLGFQNTYNQLNLPSFNTFGNIWAGEGHGLDAASNFGFGDYGALQQYATPDLFGNLSQDTFSNDYLNFQVRPDLANQIGSGGALYGTTADQMYKYFETIPGALQDQKVLSYLDAMDKADASAGIHNDVWQASQAKRSIQTTGAVLAAMGGAAGIAGGLAGAGAGAAGEGLGALSAADLSSGFAALPAGSAGTVGGGVGLSTVAGSGALVNPALWSFGGSPLTGLGGVADASWGVNPKLTSTPMTGADTAGLYDPGYGYAGAESGQLFPGLSSGNTSFLGSLGDVFSGNASLGSLLGGGSGSGSILSTLGSLFGGGGGSGQNSGIGGLLGAILGGTAAGLGSQGNGTVDVTTTPWGPQQPYLTQGFGAASNQLAQSQANPSQVLQPAEQGLLSTIQGDYLNPETNPYLKQTYDLAAAQLTPGIESYYAKFGRQGSGAAGNALGNAYASLGNQIYGGNYQQERSRQNAGILAAPGFAQTGYNAQFAPVTNYMNAIRGNYGGTQSTPYTSNIYGEILSGALGGSQLLGGLF